MVQVNYYNAPLKENFNKKVYWNQMGLFERLRKTDKFRVVLCKRQKRVDKDDNEYYEIKGDDINLSLDMLRDACKNKYDKAILVSGDGDFARLLDYVRNEGKEVELYAFQKLASMELTKKADSCKWITKKITNRFFYRQNG